MAWRTMGKIASQCANSLPAAVRRAVAERQAGVQGSHCSGKKRITYPGKFALSSAKVVLPAGRE